jgi:hypothetical protein
MAGFSMTGQMKVSTLQEGFLKEFGLTLRVYDGRSLADENQTLSQVSKKEGTSKGLSVAKNMKVGNLEKKIKEEFGITVQIAGSDDSYLCENKLSLKAAVDEDGKKLVRKARKEAKQDDVDEDDTPDFENIDETVVENPNTPVSSLEKLALDDDPDGNESAAPDTSAIDNLAQLEVEDVLLTELSSVDSISKKVGGAGSVEINVFSLLTGEKIPDKGAASVDNMSDENNDIAGESLIKELDLSSLDIESESSETKLPDAKLEMKEFDLTK